MITQKRLKELLHYNPDTGILTWIKQYHSRFIGREAGRLHPNGYRYIKFNRNNYMSHRMAWLYVFGEWPSDQLDHINHIRDDNRIINLRAVSNRINSKNQSIAKNNTHGIIGVYKRNDKWGWRANIHADSKQTNLGTYKSFFDACCARKSAEKRYGYHENHGQ